MSPKKLAARNRQLKKAEEDPEYFKRITSSTYYRKKQEKKTGHDVDPYEDIRY